MESKIVFGKMIDYYRKKNNLTMEELGTRLGKTKSTISRWVSGERYPKIEEVEQIATFFDTDVHTLVFGGVQEQPSTTLTKITDTSAKLEESRQTKVLAYVQNQLQEQEQEQGDGNIIQFPVKHDIQLQSKVSAGRGVVDLDPSNTETITYYGKLPRHFDMAFKVDGNSMEPVFEDGDIIFVEKMDEIINGALMVVTIEDEAFIKKVYKDRDCIRLVSLNKEYDDIRATEGIKVIGKVVF